MNPFAEGTERHALLQKILDKQACPYLAAERAGVRQYGTAPRTGWITAATLQEGPHTPSVWHPVGPEHDEPVALPWIPTKAIERD